VLDSRVAAASAHADEASARAELKSRPCTVDEALVRHVSILRLALLGAVLACGLTACGSRQAAGAPGASVQVRERDFRILVSPARVPAGRVRLTVRNAGPADHELILVRAKRVLPLRTDGLTVDEARLAHSEIAALEPAGPGAVRHLDVTLAPGSYELFCNMAGHYMGGMRAFLVVT
jgi:uncharacterized cupredoxin-like copper-binding protein